MDGVRAREHAASAPAPASPSRTASAEPLIRISGLSKTFTSVRALDDVTFDIPKGQVVTLLGPSGCGKSTTLRIIAGLERADAGEILLGGVAILSVARGINLPPERRDMGMVFQSYAIWPHMTVAENVAYPLRLRGMPGREVKQRVAEALRLVDLQAQANRDAPKLSGGQQQRVALARALVYEPKVMLLDEPLSNLDVKLREQMRFELKLLQRKLNLTLVYVTHDQAEALSLSDQIVLMHDGRVEQRGTPRALYEHPATPFARDFLGKTIALAGRIEASDGRSVTVSLLNAAGRLQCATHGDLARPGANVTVAIRPEKVRLVADGEGANRVAGKVETVLYQGERSEYLVRVGDALFSLYAPGDATDLSGRGVTLQFDPDAISLWPR